jgi:hypothetical protein
MDIIKLSVGFVCCVFLQCQWIVVNAHEINDENVRSNVNDIGICKYKDINDQITLELMTVSGKKRNLIIRSLNKENRQMLNAQLFGYGSLPDIRMICKDNGFAIEYQVQLGNSYAIFYDLFTYLANHKNFVHSNTAAVYSDRNSLSIYGANVKELVGFENYDIDTALKLEGGEIFNFSGFQEGKEPDIKSVLSLIKQKYKTKDIDSIRLIGNVMAVGIFSQHIPATEKNSKHYRNIIVYLKKIDKYNIDKIAGSSP